MLLKDKIALVTGASRGIGLAILLELAKEGAVVIGTATTEEGAARISDALIKENFKGKGIALNVCDTSGIEEAISSIEKEFGAIYALINNAGITRDNLTMRMKDSEWDEVIDTNLKAVFRTSRAVIRSMMKARSGRIINISSVVGHLGNAGQLNYCATKAGVSGMSKSLAREVGSRHITVNCVAPGFIDTDMTRALTEEQKNAMLANIPLASFGKPEDIAKAVAFLASENASYITGTTIHVNGGMFMN